MAKAAAARRLPGLLHEAISVRGGNGFKERLIILARLRRDSIILETWQGPYTPLLMHAPRGRGSVAGREAGRDAEFLAQAFGAGAGAQTDAKDALAIASPPSAGRPGARGSGTPPLPVFVAAHRGRTARGGPVARHGRVGWLLPSERDAHND